MSAIQTESEYRDHENIPIWNSEEERRWLVLKALRNIYFRSLVSGNMGIYLQEFEKEVNGVAAQFVAVKELNYGESEWVKYCQNHFTP